MALLSGTAGSVVYMTGGTTNVGGIAEWSLDLAHSPVEVTAFGNNWEKYVPSVRGATGRFMGNFDHADTAQGNLISAMLGGSAIALRLYLDGTKYFNIGTAYLSGMSPAISQKGKGDNAFSFQVSDAVTFV